MTKAPDRESTLPSPNERAAATEAYAAFIKERGIRDTQARRRILAAVFDLPGHFEADQVLYLLRERGAKVGKATLYRTLPLLVEAGVLQIVRFDTRRAHYKFVLGRSPRDQLLCRRCGRIIEFESPEIIDLRARIADDHGFELLGHRFQLTGLCPACTRSSDPPIRNNHPQPTNPHSLDAKRESSTNAARLDNVTRGN